MKHKLENKPRCPHCKTLLDGAANATKEETTAPEEGDASVCMECSNWLVYAPDMTLRPMTEEEIQEMDGETFLKFTRISKVIHEFKKVEKHVLKRILIDGAIKANLENKLI